MTYKEEVNEFLRFCKEEKEKGNRLVMSRDMTAQSVPTLKSHLIKLFKPK